MRVYTTIKIIGVMQLNSFVTYIVNATGLLYKRRNVDPSFQPAVAKMISTGIEVALLVEALRVL